MAQLRAGVINKDADTDYKRVMTRFEPFKAILGATAAIVAGVFGAPGYILGRGH